MTKHKILMLCDHPLSNSGVGTQSRWLINGLLATGKYSFRVFGGAVKHESYNQVTLSDDFIIKPMDGFGNCELLRITLAQEKPDAILLFTDPRFFIWVWEMEDEIHQICPIAYWHLWDNPPWPEYNRVLYESTDLVNCINYPTFDFVNARFPEKTNFIPHAVPKEKYRKLPDDESRQYRQQFLQHLKKSPDEFIGLWINRNARRKNPSDVLESWKMFLNALSEKYGHRNATLIMHTDPFDEHGPNLIHVTSMLGIEKNVWFSTKRLEFDDMCRLYNMCDFVVNCSLNEGFGLSTLEGMQCGKPIIALKTGGLTRQVVDYRDGSLNGIALDVDVRSMVGSQQIPYIYEDFVSNEKKAEAYMKMFELGDEGRRKIGEKAMRYVDEEFNLNDVVKAWDSTLSTTINEWRSTHKTWKEFSL